MENVKTTIYCNAMKLGVFPFAIAMLLFSSVVSRAQPAPAYQSISYVSGSISFPGYIFKPEGDGPFPVVVFNHGHAKNLLRAGGASEYYALAKLVTNDGYVLFVPDRHMRYVATNEFSAELLKMLADNPEDKATVNRRYTEVCETNGRDVAAAIQWLRQQSYVDGKRITLTGWSSGAAASLWATELDPNIHALVLFSPAVTQWGGLAKEFFRRGLQNFNKPVFVVMASNDETTEPAKIAREILATKSASYQVQIYPHTGNSGTQYGSLAISGWQTWGYDVMVFLEKTLLPPKTPVKPG